MFCFPLHRRLHVSLTSPCPCYRLRSLSLLVNTTTFIVMPLDVFRISFELINPTTRGIDEETYEKLCGKHRELGQLMLATLAALKEPTAPHRCQLFDRLRDSCIDLAIAFHGCYAITGPMGSPTDREHSPERIKLFVEERLIKVMACLPFWDFFSFAFLSSTLVADLARRRCLI